MNVEELQADGGARRPSARVRWVGGVLVALLFAVLVWQAWEAGHGVAPTAAKPPASLPVEALARPSMVAMLARADAARLSAQAASAVARKALAPPAPLAADETEICGVGRVKADASGQPKDMARVQQAAQRVRELVLPMLLNSGDDIARGAGLLMQALGDPTPAEAALVAVATGDVAPGEVSPGDAAVGGGVDATSARARDELAALAAFKGSPQLYAWAMRACQQQRGEGACRMLSADQWARLEPGNAMAWLHVAGDAQARGDRAAVAEAMYRVSHAPKSDARFGSLLGVVYPKLPAEADLLARVSFGMEVAKADARAEIPLVAASQYCTAAAVRDFNRHQVCATVAEVLAKRGSTLAETALGASIGERVGWPAERVAALADERDAMAQLNQQTPTTEGAWSCAALARNLGQLTELGQHGEMATLRAALKRSTDGAAKLAQRYRDALATRVAEAASAASAASGLGPVHTQ